MIMINLDIYHMFKKLIYVFIIIIIILIIMSCLMDRFNVISPITETSEYSFENYIRNYIDGNVICHYSLIKSQYDENKLFMLFKNNMRTSLVQFRKIFNKISISHIHQNIFNTVNNLQNILKMFNKYNEYIVNKIMELYYDIILNSYTMINVYNNALLNKEYNKIKSFFNYLNKTIDKHNYENCIYTFSDVIKKNIPDTTFSNYKYEDLYNLKKLFNYTFEIINSFENIYLKKNIIKLLYDKIYDNIYNIIILNSPEYFINFLKVFSNDFSKICKNNENIKEILYHIKINNTDIFIEIIKYIINIETSDIFIKKFISKNSKFINEETIKRLALETIKNFDNNIDNQYIYVIVSEYNKYTDLFFSIIEMLLKKRIIYYETTYQKEYKEFNILSKYFKPNEYYKYHKIVNDIKKNIDFCIDIENTKVFYISNNVWNIDTQKGYNLLEDKKCYLHLGNANITLKNKVSSYTINCLPIHVEIIKLIIKNKYKLTNNFTNYPDDFINKIEQQLANNNIINLTNEGYVMNDYYNGGDIDFVSIYFEDNMDKIIKNVVEELAHERKHIIMANVNSIYKKDNNISFDEIYTMIKDKITMFDFDHEYYKAVIDEMKEKCFI
jgi:hypothetical protein